jgi:hypothetical protein
MSFLLDTDHLSAHLRRPSGLAHRFFQYFGAAVHPHARFGRIVCLGLQAPRPHRGIGVHREDAVPRGERRGL